MKQNHLFFIIGMAGILCCGYFLITGKDTTTSLIGFISGTSLLFMWHQLEKK
ncbi:hypothetical protein [Mesonia aestuariivivens]|uniref:Lipoprotein n=1 Tax=Mesonia aestuariivivens TaxID=2796128 RepID=A0ABS6W0W0_9FLAO|nr:hypothetical protein [Mesonia aestuariivivens]MBW2961470.1 hypothetical protein [Mesonia aestuariivivens]